MHPVDERQGDQEGELEINAEEEAETIRILPSPSLPTLSEFLDHCVTHYPYRAWCEHCVEGRGREFGHSCKQNGVRGTPTVSFDYAFIGDKGEVTSQEQADTEE